MKEPLNIVSESFKVGKVGGPNKVITNTISGLNKIGYPFEINKDIRHFKYNWIHDSIEGLIEVGINKTPALIGPNIVVLPSDLPSLRPSLVNCIYLSPSQWCIDLWNICGFSECPIQLWPAGINIEDFNLKREVSDRSDVMIYFKRRDPLLLKQAVSIVNKMGLNPKVIKYGEYTETKYKETLSNSKFGIWIGLSESQGIGLLEALASGLPMIVCNVNSLFESPSKNDQIFPEKLRSFKPSCSPYFDNRCGIIINDISELKDTIYEISSNLSHYNPREYVVENLSIEKQARELLSFFDILKQSHPGYFSKPAFKSKGGDFRISLRGSLINKIFLIMRKTKTVFRIIKR